MTGCAVNPVTGQQQLMLVSEAQEIDMDAKSSPHQFSADYGAVQDSSLNAYLTQVGRRLTGITHRPQMPYSFRAVNANYVNAYAFPGGSIAVTRGILLKVEDEAELAALLGHELGHVNARHTAEIMSKNMVISGVVGGVTAWVGSGGAYGQALSQLGMLGSGALLASYSRDNERQADALGLEYMVKGGYGPEGMVGLMDILNNLSKGHNSAADLLFATHPMSRERYRTAVREVNTAYAGAKGKPLYRERYMDRTAKLRRIRGAIDNLQKGEVEMAGEKYAAAETLFRKALQQAPRDYAGLVLMAKCQLAQKKVAAAGGYLKTAQQVYPQEAQTYYLNGYVQLTQKQYDAALAQFDAYDTRLAGNPSITFFKGVAHEGRGARKSAADKYYRYLQAVNQGSNAQYAYNRLVEWGYIKPKKQ
jgi:predicted Zn-dependent protease